MSLTHLLGQPAMRDFLNERLHRPPMNCATTVRVPRIARYQPRIGTAFDYALRFGLLSRGIGTMGDTVAEQAAKLLPDAKVRRAGVRRVGDALKVLRALDPSDAMSSEAARACVVLAGFDVVYRAGRLDDIEREPEAEDVEDVQALFGVIPWTLFQPSHTAFLNPHFGMGSHYVGGADADVVIDDLLVDVKTTGDITLRIEYLRQVTCYALLANAFGLNGRPPNRNRIDRIGIYYSRAGALFTADLSDVVPASAQGEIVGELVRMGEVLYGSPVGV